MKNILLTLGLFTSPILASDLLPCTPTQTSTTQLAFDSPPRIMTTGNSAGLVQLENNDILVYDVSQDKLDLASIISRPQIDSFAIHQSYAIISYIEDSTLEFLDLQNPAAPITTLNLSLPANVLHIEILNDLLAISMGDAGMVFYDVSDPSNPTHLATHQNITATKSSLSTDKMLASGNLYDISDLTNPSIMTSNSPFGFLFSDFIFTPIPNGFLTYNLAGQKTDVFFDPNALFGASIRNHEFIWRLGSYQGDQSPNLTSIQISTHSIESPSNGTGSTSFSRIFGSVSNIKMGRSDQRAIFTSNNGALLFKRSTGFTDRRWFSTSDAEIQDNFLYALDGGGVKKYDLSDSSILEDAGSFSLPHPNDEPQKLYLGDRFGLIQIRINDGFQFPKGYRLFDLETLERIGSNEIEQQTSRFPATSIAVHGNRIAMQRDFSLGLFEINEENETISLGDTSMIAFNRSVAMYNDILVSNGSGDGTTLNLFDLSDPSSIQLAGQIMGSVTPEDIFVLINQNTLAVTDGALIQIFDITDPTSPVQTDLIDSSPDNILELTYNEGILNALRELSTSTGDMEAYYYDVANPNNIQLVEKLIIESGNQTSHSATRRVITSDAIQVFESCFIHCQADINSDGNLDFLDVQNFIKALLANDPTSDFNGDGNHDFFDISEFLSQFAASCP